MGKLNRSIAWVLVALLLLTSAQGCGSPSGPPTPAAGSGDGAFRQLAGEILEFYYKQDPSNATYLGIHKYDDLIADYSAASITADGDAIKSFQAKLDAVDAEALSPESQLDFEQTKNTLDGMLLQRGHPSVGEGSRHLQQRHHQRRLRDDLAHLRAARATPQVADSPPEIDAEPLAEARKNLDNHHGYIPRSPSTSSMATATSSPKMCLRRSRR